MAISTLKKLQNKHNLSYGLIKKIPSLLSENIALAFDSPNRKDSKVIFVPTEDHPTLMVALNVSKSVKDNLLLEINSVHERENLDKLIEKAFSTNQTFYITSKTKKWISAIGLQLPEQLSIAVNSITENDNNIKKFSRASNFIEVPMIDGKKKQFNYQSKCHCTKTKERRG